MYEISYLRYVGYNDWNEEEHERHVLAYIDSEYLLGKFLAQIINDSAYLRGLEVRTIQGVCSVS